MTRNNVCFLLRWSRSVCLPAQPGTVVRFHLIGPPCPASSLPFSPRVISQVNNGTVAFSSGIVSSIKVNEIIDFLLKIFVLNITIRWPPNGYDFPMGVLLVLFFFFLASFSFGIEPSVDSKVLSSRCRFPICASHQVRILYLSSKHDNNSYW